MKRGPDVAGRRARYASMDETGHRKQLVAPRWMVVPTPKGSFLLLLRCTVM